MIKLDVVDIFFHDYEEIKKIKIEKIIKNKNTGYYTKYL